MSDQDLLDATAQAIGRVGLSRLTLADVADVAGVSPATLVQRFGSKRELILAFAARAAEGVAAEFASARQASPRHLDALLEALGRLAQQVAAADAFAHHLVMLQVDLSDPALGEPATVHARTMEREIHRLLDDAVRTGELRPVDTGTLSRAVHAMYLGSLLTWALDRCGSLTAHVVGDLRMLLDAYCGPARLTGP